MVVVGFIRVLWVHSGVSGVSSGSFGFVGFIHASSGGGRVHLGPSGSLGRAIGVVWYIRVRPACRWVHSGVPFGRQVHKCALSLLERALADLAFILDRWVHSGISLGWSGSNGFIVFIPGRPWGRWVHSSLLGSFRCALSMVGFIMVCWVHSVAH